MFIHISVAGSSAVLVWPATTVPPSALGEEREEHLLEVDRFYNFREILDDQI